MANQSFVRAYLLPIALAGATLAGPRAATAAEGDKALGLALFEAGRKLLADGKVDEACGKLEQSYAVEPTLGTLLNLGVCHDKQGRTATAWAELTKAGDLAAAAGATARVEFAREQATAIQARLSRLVVKAPPNAPAGLVVRVDGRELGAAVLGTPMPLDPGDHALEIAAPGKRTFSTRVKLERGPSTRAVDVPALEDDTRAATPAPAPTSSPAKAEPAGPSATPAQAPSGRATPRLYGGLALGALVGANQQKVHRQGRALEDRQSDHQSEDAENGS